MGLMVAQEGAFDEYEAVALPPEPGSATELGSAVFLRRSTRPSRRAVLHLHDLTNSFAPADLARWYNERGFHFYVTDLDLREHEPAARRGLARTAPAYFATLDSACRHLRDADGIDAIILSADDEAAAPAAMWCHARRAAGPVAALILSNPDFGRGLKGKLDISCPVLVISASDQRGRAAGSRTGGDSGIADGGRKASTGRSVGGGRVAGGRMASGGRKSKARQAVRLGQHVTWLYLDDEPTPRRPAESPATGHEVGIPAPDRRQLFDEMGRWLGAYMYGKARDQLL